MEMIRPAHEIELFTSPCVFDEEEAKERTKAGADQLAAHVGLTTAGSIGAAGALTLDDAIAKVMTVGDAGRKVLKDILVICHGGPSDEPDSVGAALTRMPGTKGFFGASSIEQLPTERAIRGQVESFKTFYYGEMNLPRAVKQSFRRVLPPGDFSSFFGPSGRLFAIIVHDRAARLPHEPGGDGW
ncbi:MAG TPA: phosphoenolpyruvate hydrolase family protein [Syntrophobacteraceae bacterium]|nr:phosphoenolpyruvate hydrolase family protein [Syntrophobacteraceae bacterium]